MQNRTGRARREVVTAAGIAAGATAFTSWIGGWPWPVTAGLAAAGVVCWRIRRGWPFTARLIFRWELATGRTAAWRFWDRGITPRPEPARTDLPDTGTRHQED